MAAAPDELTCMVDLDAHGVKLYICSTQDPRDARSLLARYFGELRPIHDGAGT